MLALKKKGFTLIEIVIVLAIAALILVIVFLAVGGAQRAQRDQASKDAAGKVVAAYTAYLGDNSNKAPTASGDMNQYVVNIKDGRSQPVTFSAATAVATNGSDVASKTWYYVAKGTCLSTPASGAVATNDGKAYANGSDTQVAVSYWSETKNGPVCISN